MRIDAHQHYWHYHAGMTWIDDTMQAIRKDFLPADLLPVLQQYGFEGCVAVQADETDAETDFLLDLSSANPFIKGVVGWIDLRAADIAEQLAVRKQHRLLKGFRHVLQAQEPSFMLLPAFMEGIGQLAKFGFTYDILVYPQHLGAVEQLVAAFPDQPFVIDHLAKPVIRDKEITGWSRQMKRLAAFPNVHCKVSGMVTEADWHGWQQADFIPYLDAVSEAFGTGRLLFGSDWPVCLVAGSYGEVLSVVEKYFSASEQEQVLGGNATRFYQL